MNDQNDQNDQKDYQEYDRQMIHIADIDTDLHQYENLLDNLLIYGDDRKDRTGVGTSDADRYNQKRYLMETRMSGALTKLKSAIITTSS